MAEDRFPRVEWDSEAGAVYLRLRVPAGPTTTVEGGGVIVDRDSYDDDIVIGVEMLQAPVGDDAMHVPAHVWVMAARAWELTRVVRSVGAYQGVILLGGLA